eukprot:scaffold290098_cov29-Tisochrysis_lutea.AAC.4
MCFLCVREGGVPAGKWKRECARSMPRRQITLVAADGVIAADGRALKLCEGLAAAVREAEHTSRLAAELTAAATDASEGTCTVAAFQRVSRQPGSAAALSGVVNSGLRVKLPSVCVNTLQQVFDFCRRHENLKGEPRALELMWRRNFQPLPVEDLQLIARAARKLRCQPLCRMMAGECPRPPTPGKAPRVQLERCAATRGVAVVNRDRDVALARPRISDVGDGMSGVHHTVLASTKRRRTTDQRNGEATIVDGFPSHSVADVGGDAVVAVSGLLSNEDLQWRCRAWGAPSVQAEKHH